MTSGAVVSYPELSEAERFPLLTPEGRRLLNALREDPHAPRWHCPSGEQLDAAGLEQVRTFAHELASASPPAAVNLPDWLPAFVDRCLADVPFYRRRSPPDTPFHAIPSCSRADLAPQPWAFVPDSEPLDRLIVYSTSGTTGHPCRLPSHPVTAACGVPLLEHALAPHGVKFPRGPEGVALAIVLSYPEAYTNPLVVSYLEQAGAVRVNLRPEAWRRPNDCLTFLDRWPAPVVLGDPISLAELTQVELKQPPRAIISCTLTLTDALAAELSAHFGCPVLDVYALTEAGVVAVKDQHGHAILPHDLYVEILDEYDKPCAAGVRGEVTLTGGRNPYAPLLRYRTGDYASLTWQDGRSVLVGLDGRPPVWFVGGGGQLVHSMEVTRALRRFPLVQYRLHQQTDGSFQFGYRGAPDLTLLREVLSEVLHHPNALTCTELMTERPGLQKLLAYHSDFPYGANPGLGQLCRRAD